MVFLALLVFVTPAALLLLLMQRAMERKAPPLRIAPNSSLQLEKNGLINPKERSLFKRAFLKATNHLWIATGKTTSPQEPAQVAWHEKVNDYLVESQLTFAEQHGYILTIHDDTTQELQGLIGLIPPVYYDTDQNPHWKYQLQQYSSVRLAAGPFPKTRAHDPNSHQRYTCYMETTRQRHAQIMKDKPHWYIPIMGVCSADQQGIGLQLLQRALEEVTGNDLPIYLECDSDTVPFFHKLGFEPVDTFDVVVVDGSQETHHQSNAMIRPGRFSVV